MLIKTMKYLLYILLVIDFCFTKTVTISGSTNYLRGESVTVTANYALFNAPPSVDDVGDAIVLVDGTNYYRCNIVSTTSQTVATVKLDRDLPANLRNTAITTYEVARNVISGITWLEGKTVSILADGAVHPQKVVSKSRYSSRIKPKLRELQK